MVIEGFRGGLVFHIVLPFRGFAFAFDRNGVRSFQKRNALGIAEPERVWRNFSYPRQTKGKPTYKSQMAFPPRTGRERSEEANQTDPSDFTATTGTESRAALVQLMTQLAHPGVPKHELQLFKVET